MAKSSKALATYRTASRWAIGAENIVSISVARLIPSRSMVRATSSPWTSLRTDTRAAIASGFFRDTADSFQAKRRTIDVRARGRRSRVFAGHGRPLQHLSTNLSHATIRNPQAARSRQREVEDAATDPWSAVGDTNHHRLVRLKINDADSRAERQTAMRRG